MGGLPADPSICELVITGLNKGLLWPLDTSPIWFGRGTGKPCLVCKQRITDVAFQYDLPPSPNGSGPVHADCYREWRTQSDKRRKESQRDGRARRRQPPEDGAPRVER
jgi:hypothetical protein